MLNVVALTLTLSRGHFDDVIALGCMLLTAQIADVATALQHVCSWRSGGMGGGGSSGPLLILISRVALKTGSTGIRAPNGSPQTLGENRPL